MAQLTEADRYLLKQIGKGDADGWSQLVGRYQGRLLAFAHPRLRQQADAEDLVQDTFATFLQSLGTFRPDSSVETFLFTVLRRKLIDVFRGRGAAGMGGLRGMHACSIHDLVHGGSGSDADGSSSDVPVAGREMTASTYARRDEQAGRLSAALSTALVSLAGRLKDSRNLRDLRVVEMLFYAQLRNKDVARLAQMDEKQVALVKHRCLKEVRAHVVAALGSDPLADDAWDVLDHASSLLTEVWEQQRPTCPKRSTIGRYLLGTLEPDWQQYVGFHLKDLGCRLCQANLKDLQRQDTQEPRALREKIFQSTVGFLSRK